MADRQLELLLGIQERKLADLAQVLPQRIGERQRAIAERLQRGRETVGLLLGLLGGEDLGLDGVGMRLAHRMRIGA